MLEAKGNVRAKSFLDQMDIQNKNVLLLIMKLLRLIVLNSEVPFHLVSIPFGSFLI